MSDSPALVEHEEKGHGAPLPSRDTVLSEVHIGLHPTLGQQQDLRSTIEVRMTEKRKLSACRPSVDQDSVGTDDDGDLDLAREQPLRLLVLQHHMDTPLDDVGLQIWTGSFVLLDFLMHHVSMLQGRTVLELGAGVGVVSIAIAPHVGQVFVTDKPTSVLRNCLRNVSANLAGSLCQRVHVRRLDWGCPQTWRANDITRAQTGLSDSDRQEEEEDTFTWSDVEKGVVADRCSLLLASDCIYDEASTDEFFATVRLLLGTRPEHKYACGSRKILLMSLEKRYNFDVKYMRVEANGYRRFLSHVRVVPGGWTGMVQSARPQEDQPCIETELLAQRVRIDDLPKAAHLRRDEAQEEQHRAAMGAPDVELWAVWAKQ